MTLKSGIKLNSSLYRSYLAKIIMLFGTEKIYRKKFGNFPKPIALLIHIQKRHFLTVVFFNKIPLLNQEPISILLQLPIIGELKPNVWGRENISKN